MRQYYEFFSPVWLVRALDSKSTASKQSHPYAEILHGSQSHFQDAKFKIFHSFRSAFDIDPSFPYIFSHFPRIFSGFSHIFPKNVPFRVRTLRAPPWCCPQQWPHCGQDGRDPAPTAPALGLLGYS